MPPNRLSHETSPYLRQHAENPVDWYPWGEEALAAARALDRPILLSVGYSACHWCHVMAHESFADPHIAAVMNSKFVNIKVDREERPDLDHLYQLVCQLLTRQGGWPLTVFLTPAGEPFFAGTYFPPDDRYGRPGFAKVLTALANAYRDQREQVAQQAQQLVAEVERLQAPDQPGEPGPELLDQAARLLMLQVDRRRGGFGDAPKFPNPLNLELLLREHARSGEREPLELVVTTCRAMRAGGIYDQLGGGFHRYSVDGEWLVPHFEKMLYDNALLPPVYLATWQMTGQAEFADCARETLDYLLRDMRHPDGGFFSATDADSEGEEGRYFVWTPEQVAQVLDPAAAALVGERYGITRRGNFEHGATVLSLVRSPEELAAGRGVTAAEVETMLSEARARLLAARAERVPPLRDEKILCGWNALTIIALCRAGLALAEPRFLQAAVDCGRFLLETLYPNGRLLRVWCDGRAKQPAFLEDYAGLALALLELFGATGDPGWLPPAERLLGTVLDEFCADGRFYMTAADAEPLVVRPVDQHDNVTPSGTTLAVRALLRWWHLTGDESARAAAEQVLHHHEGSLRGSVWGAAGLLAALDESLAPPRSVCVAGEGEAAQALLQAAAAWPDPNLLVCRRRADVAEERLPALLRGRDAAGPAAFVCHGFACLAPVATADELRAALSG